MRSTLGLCLVSLGLAAFEQGGAQEIQAEGRQELLSFRNSDGSLFVPQDFYPEFSWEVTPQYFMFGDTQRVLKPEEVRSIAARTGFLCIEKSHGLKELGAAELGARHEAAAFKKLNSDAKVLFYFNAAYAYSFTSYSKGLSKAKIDQNPDLKKFLLVDPETGELAHRRNVFFFDVLNPKLREWWTDTVAKGVADSGCDGAFIDQMHGFRWLRQDKTREVERAMGEMMATLKKKMGPDKILLGNNAHQEIAADVFPVVDAIMFEHYDEKLLSKESLLRDWQDMLRIARAGKMSIFRIGVEQDRSPRGQGARRGSGNGRSERMAALARERLEYHLACYLIGAQPYSYFQYGWGWTLSSGALQDYPEMHKPLGAPKCAHKRTDPAGWEFTRDFEHAQVWVDTEKGQGKITWQK
ncbi:MAG: putative glycoside hydrolase [Planctomycetota bacterium]|jgi:hypothetical protein